MDGCVDEMDEHQGLVRSQAGASERGIASGSKADRFAPDLDISDSFDYTYHIHSYVPQGRFCPIKTIHQISHAKLLDGLRENLKAVIDGNSTPQELNRVIKVSHTLANALLLSKSTTGTLAEFHRVDCSELAYDCIAEIFSEFNNTPCAQLKAYFSCISFDDLRDEEILIYLRRLVFSKVNEGIFRLYNEADPILGKIIRNIKRAVQSLKLFDELEHLNEPSIAPSLCEKLEHLPPADRDLIEHELSFFIKGTENIPDMLSMLSRYLREQEAHCRIVPVIAVAIIFRSLYTKEYAYPDTVPAVENLIVTDETVRLIKDVCRKVKEETKPKYVGKQKVTDEVFDIYFDVIEMNLYGLLLSLDGHDFSFFTAMQQRMPDLSRNEYKTYHKNKLEYLARWTYRQVGKELKK